MGVNNWPWNTQQLQMGFGNEANSVKSCANKRLQRKWPASGQWCIPGWAMLFLVPFIGVIFSLFSFTVFSLQKNCSVDRIISCRALGFCSFFLVAIAKIKRHDTAVATEASSSVNASKSGKFSGRVCNHPKQHSPSSFFYAKSLLLPQFSCSWLFEKGERFFLCVLSSRSATAVRTPAFSFRVSTTSHSSRSLLEFKDAHCPFFIFAMLLIFEFFVKSRCLWSVHKRGNWPYPPPASILRLIVAHDVAFFVICRACL